MRERRWDKLRSMADRVIFSDRRALPLLAMVAIAVPVIPLLVFSHQRFNADWEYHLWVTAYFREYFLQSTLR